jgi:pentatricopeptide repeat protein
MDSYQLQKLEDLIARYSIIIFIYLRCGRINEAKEIFLVMLKENIKNMIKVENLLVSIYKTINRRINIHKDVPKLTYQLAKIYSFIIKYSQLFNLTNYRNIFIDKYFQIQHLNYNFFMLKGTTRGFSSETRNQIRYWFSYCLHNAMFYTIYHRFPMKIPIYVTIIFIVYIKIVKTYH